MPVKELFPYKKALTDQSLWGKRAVIHSTTTTTAMKMVPSSFQAPVLHFGNPVLEF